MKKFVRNDRFECFAIKDKDGLYYTGLNQWNKQIRRAKLYNSEKHAKNMMLDSRWINRNPYLVKVLIQEIKEINPMDLPNDIL